MSDPGQLLAGKKILVVDDEADICEMVKLLVESEGAEGWTALSGPVALDLIRAQAPDLVLLDIMMPEMDGIEVARQLREDPATAALPVVMLTAKNEIGSIAGCVSLGMSGFVVKPFSTERLVEYVSRKLEPRQEPQFYVQATEDKGIPAGGYGGHRLIVCVAFESADGEAVINSLQGLPHVHLRTWYHEETEAGQQLTELHVRANSPAALGGLLNAIYEAGDAAVHSCDVVSAEHHTL